MADVGTNAQSHGAKMDDLASDARLLELLTDEVIEGAARWWNRALEHAG
jgi:hypothetical protein